MSILNENSTAYPGHKLPSLFNMISLENHVPDKLHIMLHITDHLQELVLQEIKNEGLFNDVTQNIIIKKMENLKIQFEFWKIYGLDNTLIRVLFSFTIMWALCNRKGGNYQKKSKLHLYAKYDFQAEICPELTLTQKIFFWRFPPFLLQKAHVIQL